MLYILCQYCAFAKSEAAYNVRDPKTPMTNVFLATDVFKWINMSTRMDVMARSVMMFKAST